MSILERRQIVSMLCFEREGTGPLGSPEKDYITLSRGAEGDIWQNSGDSLPERSMWDLLLTEQSESN
jgi:hypothetical protein